MTEKELKTEAIQWCIDNSSAYVYSDDARKQLCAIIKRINELEAAASQPAVDARRQLDELSDQLAASHAKLRKALKPAITCGSCAMFETSACPSAIDDDPGGELCGYYQPAADGEQ